MISIGFGSAVTGSANRRFPASCAE